MIFESDHSQIPKVINTERIFTLDCVVAQIVTLIQFIVVFVHLELVIKVVFSSGLLLIFDNVCHEYAHEGEILKMNNN